MDNKELEAQKAERAKKQQLINFDPNLGMGKDANFDEIFQNLNLKGDPDRSVEQQLDENFKDSLLTSKDIGEVLVSFRKLEKIVKEYFKKVIV